MSKITLGFIGKLAAGKGTSCQYLVEKNNAKTVMFSQSLRDVLDRLYIEETRENLQKLSQILRENFSQDILSKVVFEDVRHASQDLVCVDGIRRPKDIEYLRKLDNFYLIKIEADQETRYERLIQRGQNLGESETTFEEFKERDTAEAESLIDEVAKEAKFTIDNNSDVAELHKQIEDILKQIK